MAAASFKKLNSNLLILVISAIAACAKVFWVLIIQGYGSYYVSIALIALMALLFTFLPKKLEKSTGIYLLVVSTLILIININTERFDSSKITTNKGNIYTNKSIADSSNRLIKYINKNTDKNDKIVIFPEGMTINFLTDRKADDFYNSLLPLYTESLGEDKIIEHYKTQQPEYIIINNLKSFCQPYRNL